MKIRIIQDSDSEQIKKIWKHCFNDSQQFIDWYFLRRFNPIHTLGIEENGHIVSNLQMIPYTIMMRDTEVPMYYLAGVATLPEYRNRGFVTLLLKEALHVMNQRKIPVSCLYPFHYGFYRKYGWEITSDSLLYTLPINSVKSTDRFSFTIEKIDFDCDSDLIVLNDCYHKYMKQYNGYICRNINDWIIRLEDVKLDGGNGYILYDHHIPAGYLLYYELDKHIKIEEMVFQNKTAEQACLQFIASLHKSAEKIIWNAPRDNNLYQELGDPRGYVQLNPWAMSRITNVMMLLRTLKIAPHIAGRCTLQVIDDYASWNHITLRLDARAGSMECILTEASYDITCTIGTLTQIVWGYLSPFQALHAGKLHASLSLHPIEFLELLFPGYSTIMYEMY